jgi:hypothetical protein
LAGVHSAAEDLEDFFGDVFDRMHSLSLELSARQGRSGEARGGTADAVEGRRAIAALREEVQQLRADVHGQQEAIRLACGEFRAAQEKVFREIAAWKPAEMAAELKQIRRLAETLTGGPTHGGGATGGGGGPPRPAADDVLGMVLGQCDTLRHDVRSRRRNKRKR